LRGLDLDVAAGEFVTLLGPSGCGKTTTLRIIAGLESPDSGTVTLSGEDVTSLPPNRRAVNTVFQNYALFPHMSVERNIAYALRLRGASKSEIRETVSRLLSLVRLDGYGKRMPSELSGGQSQRIAIARAVASGTKLLLLDEPLGALDLQLRRAMQSELKSLQKALGIAFVYITHDQEEALSLSDRVAVMRAGTFEQIGTITEVYESPRTAYVARFVGEANVLRGESGSIAVRQEHVRLSAPESGASESGLRGTVTSSIFAGGQARITVELSGGEYGGVEIVSSSVGLARNFAVGDTVNVSWGAEYAVTDDDG
jgi:spermidine/putrescine transport system ATP-binding protein